MKERIKKFFKDHENEINIATFVAGTTAAIVGVIALVKTDGLKIAGLYDCAAEGCSDHVFVLLKNGTELPFTKPTK